MKTLGIIAALLVAGAIGYQFGRQSRQGDVDSAKLYGELEHTALKMRNARADGNPINADGTPMAPKMTVKEFYREYESTHVPPACYGHPKNRREVELVAEFNLQEGRALTKALNEGTVDGTTIP